jgi:hypothetical protein
MAEARRARCDAALAALDSGQIDEFVAPGPLRDEFLRVRNWWFDVCSYVSSSREHPVLRDETEYAVEWCIGLVECIIDEERDRRIGKEDATHEYSRRLLWERFENLQRGLKSNGVARSVERR